MQKPAGWQEEQAVEIRRDWIAFLADGMGIDTRGATGADLEALVVRTMLEQAEDDLFQDSFDEWDTDEEEEEDRLHPKGERRKGVAKGRKSRSHSRTRYLSSCADEDDGASSAASGGGGGLKAKKRQPLGGMLGSKLLRRSQTTGDMDATQKGGAASRNQGHSAAAAAAAGGRSSSRDAAAHGPGRGKAAGSLAPGGPPGTEADALTSSGLLSVDPAGGGGGAGMRRGSGGSETAAAASGKGGGRSRRRREGGRGGGAAGASAAAAASPSVQLLLSADRKGGGGGGGGGGDVAGFLDSKMSAAIEAAIFAANTSSGSFEASFSEDKVGGGRAAPANAAAAGGILGAAPTGGGGGSKSRWGLGVASSSSRQHGGRDEDGGERPRADASAAAVAAERLAKGSASEPRVATSSDGRGKQQSRQTVLLKTAAASTGGSGAGGGGLSALPRGGVDDPAPEDIARLGDRRPSGNGVGPAPPSSRGGTWADGFGRKGSSSRRPSIAPGPSSEEREEAAAPQEGEGGREEGELAREAVAAVARAIANGSATAANGAIDEDALLAASMLGEAPTEEVGRSAANTTPFYTERTRSGGGGGGGDASHKSSRPSRRGSRTKARPTGTDPARSDRKRAISAGRIGPDLRYEGAGGGSRGSSRDGGSGRVGGRGEPKPAGGQKPRGRSRERRGVVARNGTEAVAPGVERAGEEEGGAAAAPAPAPGGVGLKRDSDSSRSVVQNTGAAAAAAAAADDGGYGSDWDKLEMHRAVYASDKPGLRLFMQARPRGLKQADHHGNTPLLLALKLGRTEMAWLMVRAGAELDLPSDGSFHLLDEAIVHGDEDLLVEVYGRLQRQSWARWRAKVPDLLSLLDESIPDFYMEMHWSFECSNVLAPIVKAVAPHDHYRIWKKGSWLRMDSTITGYTKRLKTQRGKVSLLFLGNDSPAPGTLIKLDHGKRKIYNVLRRLESPTPSEVRRTCRRYLSPGQSKRPASQVDAYVIKSSALNFKPVKDYSGKLKTGTVGPWACEMYECTGDMQLQAFRKGAGDNLLSGLSMKNYFDVRQTLEEKVMRAGGNGGEGSGVAATPSSGPGSLFNFGERSAQSQKAKMLAKLNTPHKRFEKKIKASMWMSQDFPLTLEHVTPMLEVLSMQDKVIHKLKEVLTTKGMREAGFPAKVSLPLYLGVYAAVTFDNCKVFKPGELEPELFLVKPDYSSSRRMQKVAVHA
ncbi:conserved unknown protein [Ectocarpus siliculosus]|uniref:Ankyrin repeat domain-containing protein n=1 Tax=Ectocarpus siliculosus TaxID=2880 RepID=D8LIX3_ECTSI|nr:conserved unknown protein [Ectocarpus siliculosus]|eukprot:CBN76857.1 conserved unknown protein [Ectocarpus siliculosus]